MSTANDAADRAAPGQLRLVQEFLNTPTVEPTEDELRMAQAIRRASKSGATQPALASRYGVSQQLVSAILRRKRLVPPGSRAVNGAAITSLGSTDAARAWLLARGFLQPREELSPRAHRRILKLHRVLMALALANNGEPLPRSALSTLDRLAAQVPMVIEFRESPSPALSPIRQGVDAFIGAVLAAVYDAARDGSWTRLKACPADRCHHVFFDTSRNRTATWCSMTICGNRTKVRQYQHRRRIARTH